MEVSHSVSFALVLAAVVLLAGLVSCGSPQEPTITVPTSAAVDVATPAPPEPTETARLTEEGDTLLYEGGDATALVQERIRLSDVVVKASLVSAREGMLTFQAIQYLKGTGPDRMTVEAETENRNTQWDNQDAVLFLKRLTGSTVDFSFTDSTHSEYSWGKVRTYSGVLPEGYTVDSRNPVWLPIESSGASDLSLGRSTGGITTGDVITEYSSDGRSETISQSDLRDAIDWVSGTAASGSTSWSSGVVTRSTARTESTFTRQQILDCVEITLWTLQYERDSEALRGEPRPPRQKEVELPSTYGKGWRIVAFESKQDLGGTLPGNQRYPEFKLTGRDAQHFGVEIWDADNNSRNGFGVKMINLRPLPAATYKVNMWTFWGLHKPCGYPLPHEPYQITVTSTAPPGTVHEAFFDPATTTSGVGFLAGSATTTGVLEPAGFSMRGRDINITGLEWRNGQVVLSFDRIVQLSDGLSFIETDGTAGLYLSQYDDTEDLRARTATWDVPEQLWEPGDELMLQIGPIPLPGVRNLTAERGSDREVVLSWEVEYTAGVNGYRIWRHQPGRDEGPRIYVSDTLSTDTTYTDANSPVPNLTEYRVQAIDRVYNAGESSESVRVGSE